MIYLTKFIALFLIDLKDKDNFAGLADHQLK